MEERKQKDQGAPPAQSKASHTPGPWESCGDDSVRRPHVIRAAASRTIIAHTYWDSDLMDDADEPAANAKLIAAAPALADALAEYVEETERPGWPSVEWSDANLARMRAALRAAGRLP